MDEATLEQIQALLAAQGVNLTVEQVRDILAGGLGGEEVAQANDDVRRAYNQSQGSQDGKDRYVRGGIYVGRGLGGGLADALGRYKGQRDLKTAKAERDAAMLQILEGRGAGAKAALSAPNPMNPGTGPAPPAIGGMGAAPISNTMDPAALAAALRKYPVTR